MRELSRVITYPEYSYKIHLIITDDIVVSRVKRNKAVNHEFDFSDGSIPAGLHSHGSGREAFILININHDRSEHTIAHESTHAVIRLARQIDLELCEGSEEFYCYNIGYLSEELHKLLIDYTLTK